MRSVTRMRKASDTVPGIKTSIVIPAGVAHFVAAKEGAVIVQLNGTGRFETDYLER